MVYMNSINVHLMNVLVLGIHLIVVHNYPRLSKYKMFNLINLLIHKKSFT
jgi:hypothetical protein